MPDSAETVVPEPPATAWTGGSLLAGRYELGELIGRGGTGEVVAGRDILTGDAVAVKWVTSLSDRARRQLRRELCALLLLRIPGVVRLRDEGSIEERSYFVTDRIDGGPFTDRRPADWAGWRPRVVGLLDVLARVHLAGVVHRDLKPSNVFVDREERVVLLDFGLAQGRKVERSTGGLVEGTPRYMAPEQRAGRPCDERTDLYSAAALIYELVTGEAFGRPLRWEPLREAPVPPELVAVCERMLAEDPAERPRSALDVLTALGADPLAQLGADLPPPPWTEDQLRDLFVDHPRGFLHLAEDAAGLLFEAAGGDGAATREALTRWVRAGLASWSGTRLSVTREAIEQLAAGRPGSPQAELVAMLEDGAEPEEVCAEARRIAGEIAADGHLERALALLDAADLVARGTPAEPGVLQDRVVRALSLENPRVVDRMLYALQRSRVDPEELAPMATLLRGARFAFLGEVDRALETLGLEAPELPEPLAILWQSVRCRAANQASVEVHEGVVVGLEEWARGSTARKSKWLGWLGFLRYRQMRYAESARVLLEAADGRTSGIERAHMWYMASAAKLEVGDKTAVDLARRAEAQFRRGRNPVPEAGARWVSRAAQLRWGDPGEPDLELVEVSDQVPPMRAVLILLEAMVAFRRRREAICRDLAARIRDSGLPSTDRAVIVADALAIASGAAADPSEVADRASGLGPQLEIQILGLLSSSSGAPERWRARARDLLPLLRGRDPDVPMDLISLAEACRWLGVDYSSTSVSGT